MRLVIFAIFLILSASLPTLALNEVDPNTLTEELPPPQIPVQPAAQVENVNSEADIPVQLDSVKKETSTSHFALRSILSFVVIGGISLASYFLIGKYRRARIGKSTAPEIKVLTQHYLGPKKSLAIIRVAGESVLIGVTDHNINLIKSLSLLDEEIPEHTPEKFESALSAHTIVENEEFAIRGIKDFVNLKLKNMRSLE